MTTETTPVNEANIDYFMNNFSEEGLRYIRSDLMRDMEFRQREIILKLLSTTGSMFSRLSKNLRKSLHSYLKLS
jgi:hypothetical protein